MRNAHLKTMKSIKVQFAESESSLQQPLFALHVQGLLDGCSGILWIL